MRESERSHLPRLGKDGVGEAEQVVALQVQCLQGRQAAEQTLDVPEMIVGQIYSPQPFIVLESFTWYGH